MSTNKSKQEKRCGDCKPNGTKVNACKSPPATPNPNPDYVPPMGGRKAYTIIPHKKEGKIVLAKKIKTHNKCERRRYIVATNPPKGDGHRNGAVRKRSQVYNPKTDTWTKRDTETGRFMDGKKDGTPFKGVRKEK